MDEIVIYPKKRYLIAMAGGCLLMIGGCVYPLIYGYDVSGRDALGQFFRSITPGIFYIGIPLFSLLLFYACYRLVRPRPSVVLNEEGLFDNASIFSAGLIRWEEIESLFIYKIMNHSFLGIIPVELETVLARQSRLKRFFFRIDKGMTQAPFAIPEGGLPMTVEELLSKIELYRNGLSPNRQ